MRCVRFVGREPITSSKSPFRFRGCPMTLVFKASALESTAQLSPGERATLALDGAWDFQVEGEDAWRIARVPAPWQALFDDMRHASGTALYRKSLTIPQDWAGRQIALCFGAVNHLAEVSLDGKLIGTHEGGHLPFEFVLGTDLQGEHELEVRVTLPSSEADLYPDAPFPEVPHGKQSWYGPLGGIWQSVRLEARSPQHVTHGAISSDLATGDVRVRLSLAGSPRGDIRAVVYAPNGAVAAQAKIPVAGQ